MRSIDDCIYILYVIIYALGKKVRAQSEILISSFAI